MMAIAAWFAVFCLLQLNIDHIFTAGCDKLIISGTQYRDDLAGIYADRYSLCNGRNTYKQLDGPNYLFYYEDRDNEHWTVGPNLCSDSSAGMRTFDDAQDPKEIVSTWQEEPDLISQDDWEQSPGLNVDCYTGFQGCADISVTNAKYELSGKYSLTSGMYCFGRNVYKHSSKDYYLYSTEGYWVISDEQCEDFFVNIRAEDGVQYPEDVRSDWEESDSDFGSILDSSSSSSWFTSAIRCTCYTGGDYSGSDDSGGDTRRTSGGDSPVLGLSRNVIIGISVGGACLVIIIIVSIACACKRKPQRHHQAPQQTTQNMAMTSPQGWVAGRVNYEVKVIAMGTH